MVQVTVEMAIIIANDYIANNEKLTELRDFEDLKQEIYLDVIKRTGSYAKLETAKERCIDGSERIVSDYVERENRRNKTVEYSSLEIDVIDTRLTKVENQIDIMSIMQSIKSIMKRILTDDEYLVMSFEYGLKDEIIESEKDRLLELLEEGSIGQLLETAMLKIRLEINKSNISSFFKSFF